MGVASREDATRRSLHYRAAVKLFISYRRSDSTHAAHRVRMCLQAKFGADAVFIDREIPPGSDWEEHLEQMLDDSTGIVVLVGDEFLRRLQHKPGDPVDRMEWEIATAMRRRLPIYPVVFGALDMPDAAKLPESIRGFALFQAVFAREPAFDAAMDLLIKSIAAEHDWVDPEPEVPRAAAAVVVPLQLASSALLAVLAAAALWGAGRLILWLADAQAAPQRPAESAFWHGLRYAACTALWGLGPYLSYWLVAELRARARLPIFNLHGLLTLCNVAGILVSGGTFLLLSTLPGWRLQPVLLFPADPTPLDYAVLAAGLLGIVVAAVAVAVWEPRVRTLEAARRVWGMRAVTTVSAVLVGCGLWFAASLANSLPPLGERDPVPFVGYLMLCPALSLLLAGWQYGQARLDLRQRGWQIRALLWLVLGLYLPCTLALFAYGPTRLLAFDL